MNLILVLLCVILSLSVMFTRGSSMSSFKSVSNINYDQEAENEDYDEPESTIYRNSKTTQAPIKTEPYTTQSTPVYEDTYPLVPSVEKVDYQSKSVDHYENKGQISGKLILDEKNEQIIKLPISFETPSEWRLYLLFKTCEPYEDFAVSFYTATFLCNTMVNKTVVTYYQLHAIPSDIESDTLNATWIAENLLEVKAKRSRDIKFITINGTMDKTHRKNKLYFKNIMSLYQNVKNKYQ